MIEALDRHRKRIAGKLEQIVDRSASHLDPVSPWAADLRGRLTEFSTRGKLVRGSLVAVGAAVFGLEPDDDLYQIAAAVELIQSFLLIHDDIMDEDSVRRGAPAIYEQYRLLGARNGYTRADRFGENMGICGGDVALLIAIEAVAETSIEPALRVNLIRRIATEIADVGVAQMADVAFGHQAKQATEDEILAVYKWKTGRYTFSLPLSLGAQLAGAPRDSAARLAHWGEIQGTIFQIRDDQLGLLESDGDTGKPAGSDVAADKKTLHRLKLFAAAPGTKWETVLGHFGSPVSAHQLAEVRDALQELGVLDEIDQHVDRLDQESIVILDELDHVADGAKSVLREIADFNRERRR